MKKDIIFEELGEKERTLLLRAFDFDIDSDGCILNENKRRMMSKENPNHPLNVKFASLMPGSLEIIDGTPTALAKYLRERVEKDSNGD